MRIRNICILAHVDHGKTTLSDSLVATNGIISSKLAGQIRYLDSRTDEQERGITMKSSAIALRFQVKSAESSTESEQGSTSSPKSMDSKTIATSGQDFVVNLIDSPGHVDFSSEVSVASRLCDGALVLVDVVEGICTQTQHVLRQAWLENVRPILVLNKMDRAIVELKMTPLEAYLHIDKIIGQANALMATFSLDERVRKEDCKYQLEKEHHRDVDEMEEDLDDLLLEDEENAFFSPSAGNVVLSSAVDGWAFRTKDFARIYASRLGVKESALAKYLWGEYYFDAKAKRVLTPKHLKGRSLRLMAVQFILENIWAVYDSLVLKPNPERAEKIVASLQLKVLNRDVKSKDSKIAIRAVMGQWLPLSQAVLQAVVEKLPDPVEAQAVRIPSILRNCHIPPETLSPTLLQPLIACNAAKTIPVVAYVAKMFSSPPSAIITDRETTSMVSDEERRRRRDLLIQQRQQQELAKVEYQPSDIGPESFPIVHPQTHSSRGTEDEDAAVIAEQEQPLHQELLLGFARIYSGTITAGQKIYLLGPKYNPQRPDQFHQEACVERLFMMMGKELREVNEVQAGNVFALSGLQDVVFKNCTISTDKFLCGLALAVDSNISFGSEQDALLIDWLTKPISHKRVVLRTANHRRANKHHFGMSFLWFRHGGRISSHHACSRGTSKPSRHAKVGARLKVPESSRSLRGGDVGRERFVCSGYSGRTAFGTVLAGFT